MMWVDFRDRLPPPNTMFPLIIGYYRIKTGDWGSHLATGIVRDGNVCLAPPVPGFSYTMLAWLDEIPVWEGDPSDGVHPASVWRPDQDTGV